MSASVPAEALVNSFRRIEDQFAAILRIVPYCPEHFDVWSDALGALLLDSCSLLDSLWRDASKKSRHVTKKRSGLNMLDYFRFFGEDMSRKWLVCWGEEPVRETPFGNWSKTGQFKTKADYNALDWWTAYNDIKHDRLLNRRQATLRVTARAIAALFLAILKDEDCGPGIQQARWLSGQLDTTVGVLREDSPSIKQLFLTAETTFLTYAVGWGNEPVPGNQRWEGLPSDRFVKWFDECNDA